VITDNKQNPDLSPINDLLSSPDFILPLEALTEDSLVQAVIENGHPKLLKFISKVGQNAQRADLSQILKHLEQIEQNLGEFWDPTSFITQVKSHIEQYKKSQAYLLKI
jgi:Zn-dependent oligopeptidase